jgi:integrase/recombinase XerC
MPDLPTAAPTQLPPCPQVIAFTQELAGQRQASAHTIRNYKQAIERLRQWLPTAKKTDPWYCQVGPREARRYLMAPAQQDLSRRTLHLHISGLRCFYTYLQQQHLLEANPFDGLTLPRLPKRLPKYLNEQQMQALLNSPMQQLAQGQLPEALAWRDRVAMELLYGAGLRISELCGLSWEAVDWGRGMGKVVGKGNKQRLCPMGKVATGCLRHYHDCHAADTSPKAPVLRSHRGLRWYPRGVQRSLKDHLLNAGLPTDITPHKLRHAYATHLLDNGAQLRIVQELLGHARLSTTQVYTHVGLKRLQQAHAQAHPRAEFTKKTRPSARATGL